MEDLYQNRAVKTPNMMASIVAILGFMGLILTIIGLYGLVAYSVSRRTREIGIRMAIRADRKSVARMILKQGFVLGIAGVSVGLVVGVLACRAIASSAFLSLGNPEIKPFVAVSLLLILTAMGATYLPARRASRIDPIQALRDVRAALIKKNLECASRCSMRRTIRVGSAEHLLEQHDARRSLS